MIIIFTMQHKSYYSVCYKMKRMIFHTQTTVKQTDYMMDYDIHYHLTYIIIIHILCREMTAECPAGLNSYSQPVYTVDFLISIL